jgi:hypothetical protein
MVEILLGAGAAAAAIAGSATLVFKLERRFRRRIESAWSETARLAGGRFEPAVRRSFFRRQRARVVASFEPGIEVVVDHHVVSTGKNEAHFTRVRAGAPGAGDLDLRLRRENALTHVGKALGLGDIELGDAAFDARYLVRASDVWMTRAWIDDATRARFMAAPPEYDAHLEDGQVTVKRHGLEMQAEQLLAAMRATASLATGGITLARRWRELAATLGGSLSGAADAPFAPGAWSLSVEDDGRRFTVLTHEDREAGTRVRRELPGRVPSFEVAPGEPLGDVAAGDGAAETAWQALQPARLHCDGAIAELTWPGYTPDAVRCGAAFALLAAIRTNAAGAYR